MSSRSTPKSGSAMKSSMLWSAAVARFELDGESVDAPAGTLVFLPEPTAERYAVAEEPGTTVLAIGGKPGCHETSAWEYFFAAYSHAERGDFERAIADMNEGLAEQPETRQPPLPPRLHREQGGRRRRGKATPRPSTRARSRLCASGPTRTRTSPRSGVPRKPEPGSERAKSRDGIGLRPRDDEQRAVRAQRLAPPRAAAGPPRARTPCAPAHRRRERGRRRRRARP